MSDRFMMFTYKIKLCKRQGEHAAGMRLALLTHDAAVSQAQWGFCTWPRLPDLEAPHHVPCWTLYAC